MGTGSGTGELCRQPDRLIARPVRERAVEELGSRKRQELVEIEPRHRGRVVD
ncbi:MAG: hypothetical protein ACXW0F_12960 [Gaiellaceae bacterium]